MKIERQIKAPNLYGWAKTHLPPSLSCGSCMEGYGTGYYVYEGRAPWIGRGDPIAEIEGRVVRLFHANYFSDMEDLIRGYESATGHEITLKYWQSPKDNPLEAA